MGVRTDTSPTAVAPALAQSRPVHFLVSSLIVLVAAVLGGMVLLPATASAAPAVKPLAQPAGRPAGLPVVDPTPTPEVEPAPPRPDAATAQSVPLSASDIDFLKRVRQAGLWEIPTGQQAQQRASNPRVKIVGQHLIADHTILDQQVRTVAGQLGVTLPDTPSVLQQGWMAELNKVSGPAYDRVFADRLRAAHGTVFAVVAQVRSGTRNPLIRAFAQRAIVVVMRHMTLLESIGLVNYAALPQPTPPAAAPAASPVAASRRLMPKGQTALILGMLGAAALIGTLSIRRARRGR